MSLVREILGDNNDGRLRRTASKILTVPQQVRTGNHTHKRLITVLLPNCFSRCPENRPPSRQPQAPKLVRDFRHPVLSKIDSATTLLRAATTTDSMHVTAGMSVSKAHRSSSVVLASFVRLQRCSLEESLLCSQTIITSLSVDIRIGASHVQKYTLTPSSSDLQPQRQAGGSVSLMKSVAAVVRIVFTPAQCHEFQLTSLTNPRLIRGGDGFVVTAGRTRTRPTARARTEKEPTDDPAQSSTGTWPKKKQSEKRNAKKRKRKTHRHNDKPATESVSWDAIWMQWWSYHPPGITIAPPWNCGVGARIVSYRQVAPKSSMWLGELSGWLVGGRRRVANGIVVVLHQLQGQEEKSREAEQDTGGAKEGRQDAPKPAGLQKRAEDNIGVLRGSHARQASPQLLRLPRR
ncbi:hypothetical protein B0H12DRAFT_1079495 [Mycena haematopus]|nr:hypothetical protein B0H12DRAFT_1079495 [Mycena haematopus]